ncbi:MAG: hypothetical protein AAGA54_21495 [Myxococcota bacterium]
MQDGPASGAPTTALAKRSPDALRRAPTFYPEGHPDAALAIVLGAAPVTGGLTVATAVALVGGGVVAAALLGGFSAVLAIYLAHKRLSVYGQTALANARGLYARDPVRGLEALRKVAHSRALPEFRLEAATDLAEARLGHADIRGAIEALTIHEPDAKNARRRRNWEAGLRGEVLRAILSWLSPGSFVDEGVAGSDAFDEASADPHGVALLSMLRVLERASEPDDGELDAAWRNLRSTALGSLYPLLYVIALAVAAERLPHLQDEFHERLEADEPGQLRDVLRQLFPRMHLLDGGGYRVAAAEEAFESETAIAVPPPPELTALADPHSLVAPGSEAPMTFLATYASVITLATGMGFGIGSGWIGFFLGLFSCVYVGTPIAAIWGSRRTQAKRRAHRVQPLADLVPRPPQPWLEECASGPPGLVARSSGYRKLQDLPPSTMVLCIAVAKAEAALERKDADEAWNLVSWWFAGFSGKLSDVEPLYGTGASLVRVAALSGHLADARRLVAVLPERLGNEWDSPANRTTWGSADFAVSFAGALVSALDGAWDMTRIRLELAFAAPRVYLALKDEALLDAIIRRAQEHGVHVNVPPIDTTMRGWADAMWPKPALAAATAAATVADG